ncbi:uncharacterized protein LOC127280485 [Leptopilina boulardi]|uniref:uncharacterized protein LOC127280485 n=1 Tax=Leptopilina boulardi TaxID=63433 RepID=UPI0021F514EE|nr:uncharacterized protein LOC127280485 [Leptopilina boulardi]
MNNATIIVEQSQNFQFLSVCHYINLLGIIFHNKNYITFEQQSQSDIVVNTLIKHLTKSKNETRLKSYILRALLKGTDLYGGEEDEKLDMKYVNETFKYFINGVLFPNYSNINLYLAEMIQNSDNLNYSIFKKTVYNHLLQHHFNWEYCSQKNYTSTLPQLTIKKIFDDYIWSIFPQPEEDMSIMDVKYIYSMVGLNILRSTSSDEPNLSFSEYILITRQLDLQHIDNETYKIVLPYFSTAALFFYASKSKGINKINLNDEFWREAYKILFTEIDIKINEIVSKEIENSLPYKLEREINNTKTRTMIAREILSLYCFNGKEKDVPDKFVSYYKTLYLWITKLIFNLYQCDTSFLPDLDEVYDKRFQKIEKMYKEIERNAITKVLTDGGLLEKINPNVIVRSAKLPSTFPIGCNTCSPVEREINQDIYVIFAIIENEKIEYYAIRQIKDELTLITSNGNEKEFVRAISNTTHLKMETSSLSTMYKHQNENYQFFVERIANKKTKAFITMLKAHYREVTVGEKILNFIKSLIPLYNCIESAKAGDKAGATFSCTMDIFSFISIAGFAVSYSSRLVNSFVTSINKNYFIINALAKTSGIVTKMSLTTALRNIATDSVKTIAGQILAKKFFKDLAIASLRTLDPGFELLYSMGRISFKMLGKLFENLKLSFKTISIAKNILISMELLLKNMQRNMHLLTDQMGLVPKVLVKQNNYEIVRYFYPSGSHLFGPECIKSFGKIAELRTIQGASYKVPVVPVKSPNEISYKQYIPETGDIIGPNIKMDNNDLLRRVKFMVADMVANGRDMKITRNYYVYHNRMEFRFTPPRENLPVDLNQQLRTVENNSPQFINLHPHPLSDSSNVLRKIDYNIQSNNGKLEITKVSHPLTDSSNVLRQIDHNIQSKNGKLEIEEVSSISEQYQHKKFGVRDRKKVDKMEDIENILSHQQKAEESLINIPKNSIQIVHEKPYTVIEKGDILNSFEYSTPHLQRLQEFVDSIPGTSRQTLKITPNVNNGNVEIIAEGYENSSPYMKKVQEILNEEKNINLNRKKLDTILEDIESIASHQQETQDLFNIPETSRQNVQIKPKIDIQKVEKIADDYDHSSLYVKKVLEILNKKKIINLNKKKSDTILEDIENIAPHQHERQDSLSKGLENFAYLQVEKMLANSGTLIKQFQINPNFYEAMLKTPTYTDYVDVLKLWKYQGLNVMMTKKNEIHNLRYAVNTLAHLQLNGRFPLRIPHKLYYSQTISGLENLNLLSNLKSKDFFFNDITILKNKESKLLSQLLDSEIEIRYTLIINSPYGFVDLTHFHENFKNDYITFGDVIFTVKDTSFTASNKILNIELEQKKMSFSHWYQSVEKDFKELLEVEENLQLSRMKDIENAASFLSNNRPLTTLKSARKLLEEYILSTKPSLNVPSYDEFANDILNNQLHHYYQDWKIPAHPYIQDVLLKSHLDNIFTESEAIKRIEMIYGLTYFQDICEAFSKYNKIKDIRQHLRFEDYYILYSYTQRKSLLNIDGQRRMDAAINRLALRQSDTNRVDLMFHRAEMISEDYALHLLSLERKKFITFEENIMLYPDRKMELDNCLKMARTSHEIPLIMDIRLKNAAGFADVTSVISDETHPFYVITSRSEFILENKVYIDTINGQKVVIMKMEDNGSSMEKRMVNIAKNLEELFSTKTKFYSEFGN